jgi:hypothetical protein
MGGRPLRLDVSFGIGDGCFEARQRMRLDAPSARSRRPIGFGANGIWF